jgi:type II secretory pathway pseudopilin PulG
VLSVTGLGDSAGAPRRSEGGWTLIEMLVALMIGMVVLGAAATIFVGAVKSEPRTSAKVSAIQQGRVALERVTREVRQGVEVLPTPTPGPTQLALVTYVKQSTCTGGSAQTSIACRVTYSCSVGGVCTRTVADPDGTPSGTPTLVVSELSTPNVFTYSPSAAAAEYVEVEFSFEPAQSTDAVVLADGAALRNEGSS